jgi:hypothetical protein
LAFSSEGKAEWVRFYNEWADRQEAASGDTAAMLAKLEAYAARLALIVHCVRSVAGDSTLQDADRVDAESVRVGVALVEWFGREAGRVYSAIAQAPEDRERRALIGWIQGKGGRVTARDLQQGGPRWCRRSKDVAEQAFGDLMAAGLGRWEYPTPGKRGGHPARVFVLTSRLATATQPRLAVPKSAVPSLSPLVGSGDAPAPARQAPMSGGPGTMSDGDDAVKPVSVDSEVGEI